MTEQCDFLCAFATIHSNWPWLRQTEDGRGRYGRAFFSLAPNDVAAAAAASAAGKTSWLAVYDEAPPELMTTAPLERRILFVTEPPEIKKYPRSYLGQFGTVIAPFELRGVEKRRMLVGNPCLNWHFGVSRLQEGFRPGFLELGSLQHLPVPEKKGLISVICSNKTTTAAQRSRLALVALLRNRLGDAVHVYGRGFNPVDDKMTAIAPYKYHLVLENNYLDNFWTEKLSDAWLGWALPLYLGAQNLGSVCPAQGFVPLRRDAPEENVEVVARVIEANMWENRLNEIDLCREWVLRETNVFSRIERIITSMPVRFQRLPDLAEPVRIFGVGRADVAALYHQDKA